MYVYKIVQSSLSCQEIHPVGTSLAVQWLKLHASTAGDVGLIPSWGTKIPHAMRHGQKKKEINNVWIIVLK